MVWDGFEAIAWRVVEAPEDLVVESMQIPSEDDRANDDDESNLEIWEGVPRRMARKARLSLGYQDDLWIEILDGLNEGDEVVLEGNTSLRDESLLRLPDDPDLRRPDEEEDDAE